MEPSFADRAEGFKESGRCDGSLSGRCVVVVVGRFLTVGGLLAMKVSLMSKFKCEFNDNSGLLAGEFCELKDEVGLIFLSKISSFQVLVHQETLLRQVSCLGDNSQIVV